MSSDGEACAGFNAAKRHANDRIIVERCLITYKCTKLFDHNQNEIPDQVGDDDEMNGDDLKVTDIDQFTT